MPRLFSYGTLQDPDVQRATFGRHLHATPDELIGFELGTFRVTDPAFAASSGRAVHAIVRFNGRPESRVPGMVLEVTDDELAQADAYEPDGYARVRAEMLSGDDAWVYAEDSRSNRRSS
jgi:hypothetical protein